MAGDLQGLARGLARLGAAAGRAGPGEAARLWHASLLGPAVQQLAEAARRTADGQQKRGDADAEASRRRGVLASHAVGNLPLVVEGLGLYLAALAGLPGPSLAPSGAGGGVAEAGDRAAWQLDGTVRAMDLLDIDLTDEALLRERIYQRAERGPEESVEPVPAALVAPGPPAVVPAKSGPPPAARERRVPSGRLARVASFASLGAGLALGSVAEASRRAVGRGGGEPGSLLLTEANAERIVATLCRVRGAALKLGQILSIQDGAVIGPELQRVFDRVRDAADYMPAWQLERVLAAELGPAWREGFATFAPRPFAAASIGQVHRATLPCGKEVAVKVQYPGVADSVDSDIRNLLSVVSVMALLPEGLFIDNIAKHMAVELGQECDYRREAACGTKMRELLAGYPEYHVPRVHPALSGGQVLTMDYITGLTIDQCTDLPQGTRDHIASSVLRLVFRELFLHRYMQTDPNWANFLYNPDTEQVGLLDFGATREFRPGFVNTYFKIIDCAARRDTAGVLAHSREIGFLTGYESKAMNDAHVESVMLLAKPFQGDMPGDVFDFGRQTITRDIQALSGLMLRERLCPPPPEVYSLHRKLSGLFLLAGKLEASFNCHVIWRDIRASFRPFPEPAS